MNIMRQLEIEHMKSSIPDFGIGDSVDVHYLIKEGDKERIQLFSGTVIAIQGRGIRRTATVRRIVAGEGVERVFPLHNPRVANVTVRVRGVKPNMGKTRYPRAIKGSIGIEKAAEPQQDSAES
jgi:large subunit ribosomal protein L19